MERVAYRPLRDAPRISALISAIAVSFFIESLAVVVFTGQPRPVLQPDWLLSVWQFGDVRILKLTAFVPVMTIVLVALLLYIVHHTKPGLAMRAISKDIETTRLLGVRVDNIIAFTFFIGLSSADSVMVGKSIGAGDFKRGFTDARRFGLLSPALAVLLGVVLVLLRVPLTNLFTLSDEVKVTAQYLMIVNACIYPLRMFNHMNIVGTFRAGGDTKASLLMDAGSIWCLSVPLVALAGLVWKFPFVLVFAMTAVEELAKFTYGMIYLNSGKWIKPVTAPQSLPVAAEETFPAEDQAV